MLTRLITNLLLLAIIISACVPATPSPTPTPTPEPTATITPTATPEPEPFRIVAYVTDAVIPQIIPYDKLTHINYFSAVPNADGSLQPMLNGWKIQQVVNTAHGYGVKVLLCLGGGGNPSNNFEAVAANADLRATFIQSIKTMVDKYQFDGVDMDWEFPKAESAQVYHELIKELRAALPDKLLTAAVVVDNSGGNASGVKDVTLALFDFVNIMSYDGDGHGTLAQFEKGLDYWINERGLPKEKAVAGLPFYSHPENMPSAEGLSYAKLVAHDPAAAQADSFDVYGVVHIYNGIPTIQAKTRLAMQKASGVMFWTLDQDAIGDLSLVKAIYDTTREGK